MFWASCQGCNNHQSDWNPWGIEWDFVLCRIVCTEWDDRWFFASWLCCFPRKKKFAPTPICMVPLGEGIVVPWLDEKAGGALAFGGLIKEWGRHETAWWRASFLLGMCAFAWQCRFSGATNNNNVVSGGLRQSSSLWHRYLLCCASCHDDLSIQSYAYSDGIFDSFIPNPSCWNEVIELLCMCAPCHWNIKLYVLMNFLYVARIFEMTRLIRIGSWSPNK